MIESRGGLYSEGPGAALDGQEAHIRTLLGFVGHQRRHLRPRREARLWAGSGEAAIAAASEALGVFAGEALKLAA